MLRLKNGNLLTLNSNLNRNGRNRIRNRHKMKPLRQLQNPLRLLRLEKVLLIKIISQNPLLVSKQNPYFVYQISRVYKSIKYTSAQ